ncbi:MAG: hypothetical protein GY854_06625 [Deltaproteobacteria bacterium]|nr:hypothetical protein [Deltaproteobacteria bacterium]
MNEMKKTTIAALTIISAAVLGYELTQVRIFAYSLHPIIAYSAIAIAMLGFGLGATLLALRPPRVEHDPRRLLALLSFGLSISIIGVNILFARFSAHTTTIETMEVNPLWSAAVLLPCIVPYFLAGMVTTVIFQVGMRRIGRVYFWNLLGSAVGCAGMIILLRPLGAERLLLLTASLSAVAGVVFVVDSRGILRWVGAAVAVFALFLWPSAASVFTFQPDVNGYNAQFERHQRLLGIPPPKCELTEWDPIGRIDIYRVAERFDYRVVTIDGGAMTLMLEDKGTPGWGKPLFRDSMYAAAYNLISRPKSLVIGSGGGSDIQTALHWNAKRVTGVEISLSTLNAVTGRYADFVGWPKQENVKAFHGDGRSFAKSTDLRFDIIQMSGVDTMTNHTSSGAMVAAEDYLYTVEAFKDFLGLLEPGGILSVMRFGNQALKLSAIAVQALRELGIKNPERSIVVMRQSVIAGVLVRMESFTEEELAVLAAFTSRRKSTDISIPHYDFAGVNLSATIELLYPHGDVTAIRYKEFFDAVEAGKSREELAEMGSEFNPPTDDRPYYILGELFDAMRRGEKTHPAVSLLIVSTSVIGLASLLLIFLPALSIRRRAGSGVGIKALLAVVGYFFSIGAGFMLLEVGLIHRATVFVSTPGAAVAVVISAILISSGVGSRVSDIVSWPPTRRILFATCGLFVLSVIYRLGVEPLFELLFGLPVWARCVAAALTIAPAGFFMGWFFPLGLGVARSLSDSLVPWGIAVNGFASVMGSLATLVLGVLLGFTGVFLIALAFYAAAAAILYTMARPAS